MGVVRRDFIAEDIRERADVYDVPETAVHMSECETQVIFRPSLFGPDGMVRKSFTAAVL